MCLSITNCHLYSTHSTVRFHEDIQDIVVVGSLIEQTRVGPFCTALLWAWDSAPARIALTSLEGSCIDRFPFAAAEGDDSGLDVTGTASY